MKTIAELAAEREQKKISDDRLRIMSEMLEKFSFQDLLEMILLHVEGIEQDRFKMGKYIEFLEAKAAQ